ESQERMLFCIKKGSEQKIIDLFEKYNLYAAAIGEVTDDMRYRVYQHDQLVVDLPIELLADGAPTNVIESKEPSRIQATKEQTPFQPQISTVAETLVEIVTSPDLADKSSLFSQFDYMAK